MLNAITLCSSPNNPLTDGIQKLGGNVWGAVDAVEDPSTGMTTLTTTVWHSLHALNLAIMTVDRIVGKITLKMGYPSTTRVDRPLVCELTVDYL